MIELVLGDITQQEVDAIVNAANPTLLGGGGVDGAIHRAGGPAILAECRELGGCAPGDAKATGGGNLAARFVIHAVGPIWRGGGAGEPELLASAYRTALDLAAEEGCRSVAFPSISTGIYGYPVAEAAKVARAVVDAWIAERPDVFDQITFVLFSADALAAFQRVGEG